jgi:hypothetical protein
VASENVRTNPQVEPFGLALRILAKSEHDVPPTPRPGVASMEAPETNSFTTLFDH